MHHFAIDHTAMLEGMQQDVSTHELQSVASRQLEKEQQWNLQNNEQNKSLASMTHKDY